MRIGPACVVHVAPAGDQATFEILSFATRTLASVGVSQVLLALEEPVQEVRWPASIIAAEIRRVPSHGVSLIRRIGALQLELAKVIAERPVHTIHFHGAWPCLLGSQALNGRYPHLRIAFSPGRADRGLSWTSGLVSRLLQKRFAHLRYVPIATSLTEASVLSKQFNGSTEVLPVPVSDVFFGVSRQEEDVPLVLADGRGAEAVDLVSRLCVLLNSRERTVSFSWLHAAEPATRERLDAADVQVIGASHDVEIAQWLSRATLFIHVSPDGDSVSAVAKAMAAGVPCLVSDTSPHRNLIRHDETGLICTSRRDFVENAVLLLRNSDQRKRIGDAARAEAARRFTLRHFRSAILQVYGFGGGRVDESSVTPVGEAAGQMPLANPVAGTLPGSDAAAIYAAGRLLNLDDAGGTLGMTTSSGSASHTCEACAFAREIDVHRKTSAI